MTATLQTTTSYGSPTNVAQRIREWLGKYAGENSASLLLYEAMKALDSIAAPAPTSLTQASPTSMPWRCFHCDEAFDNHAEAAEHFGTSLLQEPACRIDIAKYREMEELVRRSNAEDTDLHREIARLQGAHGLALQREEEKGYARALRDVGLMREGSQASLDVLAERQRQISSEGWTPQHDDHFSCGAISAFAAWYVMPPAVREWCAESTGYGDTLGAAIVPNGWNPKPGDRRRELVKAGALTLAEIERLDRAANTGAIAANFAENSDA